MFMNLSYEGFSLTYVLVMIAISRDLEDQNNLYFEYPILICPFTFLRKLRSQ